MINSNITRLLTLGGMFGVTRTATGTRTNGVYVEGTTTTFDIVASIQPVKFSTTDGGGTRGSSESLVCYTTTALRCADVDGEADRVAVDDKDFIVVAIERHELRGSVHYRATLERTAKR